MSTFGQVIDRIADYMSRTDLASQIQTEINRAIQFYSHKEFNFNQNIWGFSTVPSQEKMAFASASVSDLGMPTQFIITRSSNDIYPLDPVSIYEIRRHNQSGTNNRSVPRAYAIWNTSIYFTPVPDATYSIDVYGLIKPSTLSVTTSTNIFLQNADSLIEARVRKVLFEDVLHNAEMAAVAEKREMELLNSFQQKISALQSTGILTPWC